MKKLLFILLAAATILGVYGVYRLVYGQAQMEHVALASLSGQIIRAKTVEVVGFAYNPFEIQIPPGGSIIFTNRDRVEQSATGDDGTFDTGPLKYGDSVKITIEEPGYYSYHSKPYPYVKGRIIVE